MSYRQNNELWEEICFHLNNKTATMSEELYEQRIIMVLEKMGWKEFRGEIILKQNIPIGSNSYITPDIIVKSLDKNISFVIEVKKPSVTLSNNNRNQLFSYMRQLKLDFGILFGKKIQIFYDSMVDSLSSPILLQIIELNNNKENLDFINLFKKDLLSEQSLEKYALKQICQINTIKKENDLKKEVLSSDFILRLEEYTKRILLDSWDEKSVNEVMKNITISIKDINENNITTLPQAKVLTIPNRIYNSSKKVDYKFYPSDEREFKKQLIENGVAHIKICYSDGHEEYKIWKANNFTEESNLRGNINSKTWFRRNYIHKYGVVKAIFSIQQFT
jgi:hypothetical protein